MRSNDLVPLLSSGGDKGMSIRQGVIQFWNPDTAENTVLVAGSLFTNLPMLNTSEASLLAVGNTVSVLVQNNSYAILGRMVIPGTPEAVSSIQAITNRIQASEEITSGTRNSTTWGDLTGAGVGPAVTIRIGSSGRAIVWWSCELGQTANWQTKSTPHVGVEVSGASSVAASDWNALNYASEFPAVGFTGHAEMTSWIQAATMHVFNNLNPGLTTFTMKYRHDGEVPAGNVNFNAREIVVFAL